MSKGVLGNDPFKRGAADRTADTEPKAEPTPQVPPPEKPALPDPRSAEVKKRVKGRKPGAPFLDAPDKEPQKTRIETKQKSAKPPLRPPGKLERQNQEPKAAVAAEKRRAAQREPEVTSPTAQRLDRAEVAAEKARAASRNPEDTKATLRRLEPDEVEAERTRQARAAELAAEKARAARSDPDQTKATARRLAPEEIEAERARAARSDPEQTKATARRLAPEEIDAERARAAPEPNKRVMPEEIAAAKKRAEAAEPEITGPSLPKFAAAEVDFEPTAPSAPKLPVETAPEAARASDAFDLKTGERRPIREAIRTMTVDAPSGEASTRDQVFDVSARGEPSSLQKVATEAVGRAVVTAAGLFKAIRAGIGAAGAVDLDAYGKDAALGESLGPIGDFLYDRYWRVSVSGADRIPAGPCILVANHSGALPYDGPVLHAAIKRERRELKDARWLVEDQIFYAPILGTFLNRLGAVRANPENALRLLEEGRPLIVFPEGIHGLQKPFAERYQLKRFGRGGFVKIALQTGAPIVPVAIVGAEETSPLLARIPTSLFGLPYLPVTPLGPLPLPAKWHIRIGAPFTVDDLRAAGEEEAVRVQRGTELTREAIQGMLEAMLRERDSAFR